MKKTLRRTFAVLLVPVIAVLLYETFAIIQRELSYLMTEPGVFGVHYLSPHPQSYIISSLILGFLPAILLRSFIEPVFAALAPALLITLHQIFVPNPFQYFHAPSVTAGLLFYLLPWTAANFVGLLIWNGARTRETD